MMSNEAEKETTNSFDQWVKNLSDPYKGALSVWREAMAQLRQMHNDVWNGVRFFLTLNGFIVAAIFAIFNLETILLTDVAILILAGFGLFITITARSILKQHRIFYLDMLIRKTLLEEKLGFDEPHLYGTDVCFRWKVDKGDIERIKEDPGKYIRDQIWKGGGITRTLRRTYWPIMILHGVVLIVVLARVWTRYCAG